MHEPKKQTYSAPELKSFKSSDDVWEHYKDRCTTEELAKLKVLVERGRNAQRRRKDAA